MNGRMVTDKRNMALTNVEVLLVSSNGDHPTIERMFSHTRWHLFTCDRIADAVSVIHSRPIGVVICRDTVADGSWEDLVSRINIDLNAPKVIVASEEPSTKLWNSVVQAGADYVLGIPFSSFDVLRSIGDAWHRWWFTRVREARFDIAAVSDRSAGHRPERKRSQQIITRVAGQLA